MTPTRRPPPTSTISARSAATWPRSTRRPRRRMFFRCRHAHCAGIATIARRCCRCCPAPRRHARGTSAPTARPWVNRAPASTASPQNSTNERATLWRDGRAFDLNNAIPSHPGVTLASANSINRRGQILAFGYRNADPLVICPRSMFDPVTQLPFFDVTQRCRYSAHFRADAGRALTLTTCRSSTDDDSGGTSDRRAPPCRAARPCR